MCLTALDTTLTEVDLAEIADQSKETTEERNTNGSDEDNDSAIDESEMMSVVSDYTTIPDGVDANLCAPFVLGTFHVY